MLIPKNDGLVKVSNPPVWQHCAIHAGCNCVAQEHGHGLDSRSLSGIHESEIQCAVVNLT
jgi:hypothetical protein